MTTDRTPVAENVMTLCAKCGMELNHVVVAHNASGTVEKVKCLTCGTEHKYRSSKKKPARKPAKKKPAAQKEDFAKAYQELAEKFKDKQPLPYSMSGSFKKDDVIDHKTFGMGIVTNASHDKMEVAFSDGPRFLVCNRQEAA
jgi:hypothetical protein